MQLSSTPTTPLPRPLGEILIQLQKHSVKTGVVQNRLIQRSSPPSLWSVKETKTPSEALFKLFEGVPFFLSFYLIEIPHDSIRDCAHAHLEDLGPDFAERIAAPAVQLGTHDEQLQALSLQLIVSALEKFNGNKSLAIAYLGLTRPRFYRLLKLHGLYDGPPTPSKNGHGEPEWI
jgi:hypothetical protein